MPNPKKSFTKALFVILSIIMLLSIGACEKSSSIKSDSTTPNNPSKQQDIVSMTLPWTGIWQCEYNTHDLA